MVYCHECKMELKGDPSTCYICGSVLCADEDTDWVVIGSVESKMYADFVRETLKSCHIPAIVISKSGFFGNVGLPLNPFYKARSGFFDIMVPLVHKTDAVETLDMTVGDKWSKKED